MKDSEELVKVLTSICPSKRIEKYSIYNALNNPAFHKISSFILSEVRAAPQMELVNSYLAYYAANKEEFLQKSKNNKTFHTIYQNNKEKQERINLIEKEISEKREYLHQRKIAVERLRRDIDNIKQKQGLLKLLTQKYKSKTREISELGTKITEIVEDKGIGEDINLNVDLNTLGKRLGEARTAGDKGAVIPNFGERLREVYESEGASNISMQKLGHQIIEYVDDDINTLKQMSTLHSQTPQSEKQRNIADDLNKYILDKKQGIEENYFTTVGIQNLGDGKCTEFKKMLASNRELIAKLGGEDKLKLHIQNEQALAGITHLQEYTQLIDSTMEPNSPEIEEEVTSRGSEIRMRGMQHLNIITKMRAVIHKYKERTSTFAMNNVYNLGPKISGLTATLNSNIRRITREIGGIYRMDLVPRVIYQGAWEGREGALVGAYRTIGMGLLADTRLNSKGMVSIFNIISLCQGSVPHLFSYLADISLALQQADTQEQLDIHSKEQIYKLIDKSAQLIQNLSSYQQLNLGKLELTLVKLRTTMEKKHGKRPQIQKLMDEYFKQEAQFCVPFLANKDTGMNINEYVAKWKELFKPYA